MSIYFMSLQYFSLLLYLLAQLKISSILLVSVNEINEKIWINAA